MTALHIASYKGYNNIIRYLCLKKRLDVDVQDIVSFTSCLCICDFILYVPSGWNHSFDVCSQARTLHVSEDTV